MGRKKKPKDNLKVRVPGDLTVPPSKVPEAKKLIATMRAKVKRWK